MNSILASFSTEAAPLLSYQKCTKVPNSSHSCQQLLLSFFVCLFVGWFALFCFVFNDHINGLWSGNPCCVLNCCLTLVRWTVAQQAPLSMGMSRQEYWSGLSFPFPGDLPNPAIEPRSSILKANSLPSEPSWKPDSLWTWS